MLNQPPHPTALPGTLAHPAPAGTAPVDGNAVLRILVKGFNAMEHRLLEGAVKLSQRRPPRIDLVADAQGLQADVVMIDAMDPAAVRWAAVQPWLAHKAVIWAGAKTAAAGHVVIDRHVKWPILPVLLYRALEHKPRAATAAANAGTTERHECRRVLVVDDSLAVRAHLRSLLERHGVEVVEADTAERGIAAASAGNIAFVLMDVLMPGIDGFEACRRIKARVRTGTPLPVVMLTSKSSPFDRVRGKMAGCDTYLTKPVDPAQLQELVARHVGTTPPPRANPSGFARTTAAPLHEIAFRSSQGGLAA